MKSKGVFNYPNIVVCSLLFAALIGSGTIHPHYIKDLNTGNVSMVNYNNILNRSSEDIGIPAKIFSAVVVDDNNNKWFLTELGIISFNGKKWTLHNENSKIPSRDVMDFAIENNPDGPRLWIAAPGGLVVTSLPIGINADVSTYVAENSEILSNNVIRIANGNSSLNWFGTDKGISAFSGNKWLTPSYKEIYPERMFKLFPITSMTTDRNGDSLYIGTEGAGVARVFRNDADGISGASVYAIWGPINLPSDKIYSVFIASNGTKWFGTDQGIARHTGKNTLENWTVFSTNDGLVNNFVQAITEDSKGNIWFGTRGGGISVFDGSVWTTYSTANGLNSNNILCLAADREGVVWIGTDNGLVSYNKGNFTAYQ